MSLSLRVVIVAAGMAAWAVVPIARAQAVASQPAKTRQTAAQPAAAQPTASPARERGVGHISRRSPSRHSPTAHSGAATGRSAAGKDGGVLALGATDITGNKELPKVMVIVPWKDSLGAGGVVKPTDSLLDEALQPVDRGVFQREVHYYGQLSAGQARAAPGKVAPVGDSP